MKNPLFFVQFSSVSLAHTLRVSIRVAKLAVLISLCGFVGTTAGHSQTSDNGMKGSGVSSHRSSRGTHKLELVVGGRLHSESNNSISEQSYQRNSMDDRASLRQRQKSEPDIVEYSDGSRPGNSSKPSADLIAQNMPSVEPTLATTPSTAPPEDDGFLASVFTNSSVLVIVGVGIMALLVIRRVRSRQPSGGTMRVVSAEEIAGEWPDEEPDFVERRSGSRANTSLAKTGSSAPAPATVNKPTSQVSVNTPDSLYGAYRIDQEVGKLIMGQPHRMDVLSSRASEDRRAIETSLVKVLSTPEADDDQRRRAREALEEYGFVARQCASLLLATDAFDRTSAAKSLGEFKSQTALPFLLEGLYDNETIVRHQAVMSIGELKLPSAIGALLDMARRHPDVPASVVSKALSACSLDGLDFFDTTIAEPAQLTTGSGENLGHDINHLEPVLSVEDLPETSEGETFAELIARLESTNAEERADAVKGLAHYHVQTAVQALASLARMDPEANIRALAVASLSSINHPSVFPAILIGMSDESREVRAAAARSLSRLSFDRAEGYARVTLACDEQSLKEVAHACVSSGIVAQNINRLASNDHRQAYEAFSLICMLARARMTDSIFDAICNHENMDVRLALIQLLGNSGEYEAFEPLRQLANAGGLDENLKSALLEAMYKLDQARPMQEESPANFIIEDAKVESDDQAVETTGERPVVIEGEVVLAPEVDQVGETEIEN